MDVGPCVAQWRVPRWPTKGVFPTATAFKAISAGEVVERCVGLHLGRCIPVTLQALSYNFEFQWVLPLGRALLFANTDSSCDTTCNLHVSVRPESGDSGNLRSRLTFRASRDIPKGEVFKVEMVNSFPAPRLDAVLPGMVARHACWKEMQPSMVQHPAISEAPCDSLLLQSHVTLGASHLHDLGCFALRNMAAGEVIEHVPVLPLLWADVCQVPLLRDLVFASDFVTKNGSAYVNLPLGSGAFYNHSSEPNVYPLVYQNSPFLQAFVCQEDVEMGDELLLNYGPAYWKAPWRGVPKSDADAARQDVVKKKGGLPKPKEMV